MIHANTFSSCEQNHARGEPLLSGALFLAPCSEAGVARVSHGSAFSFAASPS